MKRKKELLFIVLFVSLILNVCLGINYYLKSTYTPNLEDQDILAEMTNMVIHSEQYKEISSREKVYAIKQGVNRFNVSDNSSIYNYEIYVKTDKETYIFSCVDKSCTNISNEGWMYSIYSEEGTILPLKKED